MSSRSFHSFLAFPPSLLSTELRQNFKMTTYARPCPPPIDTLPIELLSHIFALATHASVDSEESVDDLAGAPAFNTENAKVPLAFTSVSRYWRRVALGTSNLWTSLCITLELVDPSTSSIDTRHITSYLALSRQSPIDIFIDARDPEWDFVEEEITPEPCSYSPPFSVKHMQGVFDLLLPHLSRWKSLNILTDTWKPMQTALQTINPAILQRGAPMLESLTLMRCNDFVSFSPEFEPKSLRDPSFLLPNTPPSPHSISPLPRLRYLSLRGVHVHWASLSEALSASKTGLYSLELCSHSSDVRPSLAELHELLSSNPHLRNVVISGSGPAVDDGVEPLSRDFEGVLMPNLAKLTLGYRSVSEGEVVLQLVNAPSLKALALEEATHPADPEVIDAGSMLTYVGTGEFHTVKERYIAADHGKMRKHSAVSTSTCVESIFEVGGRIVEDDEDDVTLVDFDTKAHPPYPQLETLSLKSIQSSSTQPISSMLGALANLRRLELANMTVRPLYTLLPDSFPSAPVASSSTVPPSPSMHCPQLTSISLQDCNEMQNHDLSFIVNKLIRDRKTHGACRLASVDIQLGCSAPILYQGLDLEDGRSALPVGDESVTMTREGVTIEIRRDVSEDEDMELSEDAPFHEGGAFNDPFFDAYYSSSAWLSAR